MRTRRGVWALILGIGTVGCESVDPIVSATGEDPIFRPERLDFGAVPLSRTATDSVVVTNPNRRGVVLRSLRVEGEDRGAFAVDIGEIQIPGERTRQIAVQFTPTRVGRLTADLEIFHSEALAPAVITLVGTGTVGACVDRDADGHLFGCAAATDCDDGDPEAFPGAPERCNGKDDDCDGRPDEGLVAPRFVDADGDGYGTGTATTVDVCPEPAGYSPRDGDCRDDLDTVHPGRAEVCDGLDNDCANGVDDGLPVDTFYPDLDMDRFGAADSATVACAAPPGWIRNGRDCDDGEGAVNPAAAEVCNGVDDDCNGIADDGLQEVTGYLDRDLDGFGAAGTSTVGCRVLPGYAPTDDDCDDGDPGANPGAAEICAGGVDEDCDTFVDAADPDCQCVGQNDCGPSTNGAVCPRTGAPALQCRPLCRDPGDCAAGAGCRPLPGSAGLGFCQVGTGTVAEGGRCAFTAECQSGLCFGGQCKRVCQSEADCPGPDVCGVALYDAAELGGAPQLRQTQLCQPLAGRQPLGAGDCLVSSTGADTGQCATTHCDLLPWQALQTPTPRCAQLCAGSVDCGPGQVCGIVFNSTLESPPLPGTQEGAGRFHDAILGCYTPLNFDGLQWTAVPPGVGALGAPCTAQSARLACRSHQCAQFAPIQNRCTDFCDEDSDCVTPSTPNWRCQVGELNFASLFLQQFNLADPTNFALVGICAP